MGSSLITHPKVRRLSPLLLIGASLLLYIILFDQLMARLGPSTTALSIIPLIAVSWLYGVWGGLAASVFLSLLNLYLLGAFLLGVQQLDKLGQALTQGGAGGLVALFITAIVVGKISKLRQNLEKELAEHHRAKQKLWEAKQYADLIYQIAPCGIFTLQSDRTVTSINREAAALLGYLPEELLGKSWPISTNRSQSQDLFDATLSGPVRNVECAIRTSSGKERVVMKNAEVLKNLQGDRQGLIVSFIDITERKMVENRLKDFSYRDAMTGLYNRRYLDERLRLLQCAEEFPITIFVVDVDHLKQTNDMLGHHAGDRIIQQTAQILRMVFRSNDVIARIGGDEFVIVITRTDDHAAQKIARRFYKALDDSDSFIKSTGGSISFGWQCNPGSQVLEETLRLADIAMYRDKQRKGQTNERFRSRGLIDARQLKTDHDPSS